MEKKAGKRLAPEGNDTRPAEAAENRPVSRGKKLWKDYGYMVITLAVVFVLFKVIFQLAYVPSGSMETTLPTKCLLIGWRLPYAVSDPVPERGEIVTFYSDELGKVLVKRVIGVPGDRITFRDGYTYVNGTRLAEDYLPAQGITESARSFEVPEGCFFAMGDNRTGSNDCRAFAQPYIPVEEIQGRMLVAISVGKDQSWQGIRWVA